MKEQVRDILSPLSSHIILLVELHPQHPKGAELVEFLNGVAECSTSIDIRVEEGSALRLTLLKDDEPTRVVFRAIPSGHEFTSLLLALLNLDGRGKNLPDEFTQKRISSLVGEIHLTTYISLSCPNCPDVVQALNVMAIAAPNITHEMVDGAIYSDEVKSLKIQSVPTVYADGELLHVGRGSLADLLSKLESRYGVAQGGESTTRSYDITIAGGGPAGVTAALYLARKGLNIAVVTERIGGQVNETASIENIPSIVTTMGSNLAESLRQQIAQYPNVASLESRTIESVEFAEDGVKRLQIKGGEVIESSQLIVATGAEWRRLGVDGESEYIGRGVAYCPHCDGPLFQGRSVAVIGGGNSGVEAAIDLSAICNRVTLFEYMDRLNADEILQHRVHAIDNIEVFTNMETTKVIGDGEQLTAIEVKDRVSGQLSNIDLDGLFVQIGLSAHSQLFAELLSLNSSAEIEVDRNGRTSVKGVYAAGDVTDVSYKQIIIAMGEGAKAALAAFDDRVRGDI